ncbi:MAG: patatin-like phospholipase family protein [Gemmatimonadaceae bacterium]
MTWGLRGWLAILATLVLPACAYTTTSKLTQYDLREGYRFDKLPLGREPQRNSDELFVVLAFSGGGTRAAAMSYGALAQLRAVRFHWDPIRHEPVSCDSLSTLQCQAMERSLLDEVDVISSVSGGSFTAAYYALHRMSIFDDTSRFHRAFLYHPVQGDLLRGAIFKPKNWTHLRSRIEIAAKYHEQHIFGDGTFGDLANGTRPYLILNATDGSTGSRFEFTQEQFDLLCADLSKVPVARGVAASSAFPLLLNSMTINSYNAEGCGYTTPTWVGLAMHDAFLNYRRYTAARQLLAYRDSTRRYLHVLDGGLADNLGLRGVLQSLTSTDRPNDPRLGPAVVGGWSLLNKINRRQVRTIIVITVNARTAKAKDWDTKATGPWSLPVADASAGIPMGNFTTETLELLREYGFDAHLNGGREAADSACSCATAHDVSPRFYGVEVAIENDTSDTERAFLQGAGTNFQLSPFTVDCLVDRAARLLRQSSSVTESNSQPFSEFVASELKGTVGTPAVPHPVSCTTQSSKKERKGYPHTFDAVLQYHATSARNADVSDGEDGFGFRLRVAKRNGIGAAISYNAEAFGVPGTVFDAARSIGRLRLRGLSAGPSMSRRFGAVETSVKVEGGYTFASFRLTDDARESLAASGTLGTTTPTTGSWLLKPEASLWVDVSDKIGASVSYSYAMARPTIHFRGSMPLPDRTVDVRATRLSVGLGYRIF